jgi:hypothetical protein
MSELKTCPAQKAKDFEEISKNALQRSTLVKQAGNFTQQIAEQISSTSLSCNFQVDTIKMDHQAKQINVERA